MKKKPVLVKPPYAAVKMTQLVSAQWESANGGLNFSLIGLGTDGIAYRFSVTDGCWIPYPTNGLPISRS